GDERRGEGAGGGDARRHGSCLGHCCYHVRRSARCRIRRYSSRPWVHIRAQFKGTVTARRHQELHMAMSKPEQIAHHISQQIKSGVLARGEKLPSIRNYATLYGYAKNTVITAFEMLTAAGYIEPQHGRGFYVTGGSVRRAEDDGLSINRAMDTIWLMRQQLIKDPKHQHPGDGFPPKDWLMDMRLDKFHRQVVRTGVTTLF